MNKKTKQVWLYIRVIGMIIIPITLIILPKDYFDNGQSVCVSKLILNIECYGCGLTRAIQHIIHLDFESAIILNKLSFVVFPLMTFLYLKYFLKLIQSIRKKNQRIKETLPV